MLAPSAEKTDTVRPEPTPRPMLDAFDRTILGALSVGAGISFAELGQTVGLSAPAVHDRVKKLRPAGLRAPNGGAARWACNRQAAPSRCSYRYRRLGGDEGAHVDRRLAGGGRSSLGHGRHEHVGQGALRLKVARVKPSRASPCGPERGEHQELYRFVDLPRTPVIHFLECLQPLRKA